MAIGEQLDEAGHRPQRLGEVVRGHIGELLEVGVRARELLRGPAQLFLGLMALGDVANRSQRDMALFRLD